MDISIRESYDRQQLEALATTVALRVDKLTSERNRLLDQARKLLPSYLHYLHEEGYNYEIIANTLAVSRYAVWKWSRGMRTCTNDTHVLMIDAIYKEHIKAKKENYLRVVTLSSIEPKGRLAKNIRIPKELRN